MLFDIYLMIGTRFHVGPSWPPQINEYNYVLTLCSAELAWEFLRRNPAYQRDYRLSCKGLSPPRCLKWGQQFTRVRKRFLRAKAWGLCFFR